MKKTRLLSLTLALLIIFSLLPLSASADYSEIKTSNNWNIMLVVDASGSLKRSDPKGMRYEAVDEFLDTLNTVQSGSGSSSNHVGIITFSANTSSDDSDEAMQKGILLNTGLVDFNSTVASGESAKDWLKSSLHNSPLASHNGGATDIGTAILTAQEQLRQLNNGNKCAIFLFTDGVTSLDYQRILDKSLQNLDTAANLIHKNNIAFCGVFLNNNGLSKSTEVRDIVCKAYGVSSSSGDLGNMYVELTDPSDCAGATDKFIAMLGYSISISGPGGTDIPEKISTSCVKTFRVPGIGVDEANIRVRSATGDDLPDSLLISIIAPDGTSYSGLTAASICSVGRTYRVYKLVKPMSGVWEVHIDFPENSKCPEVYYSPVFSINIGSAFSIDPGLDDLHANMDASVQAFLTQDGVLIEEPSAYREYVCTLHLENYKTGELQSVELLPDQDYKFTYSLPVDYGVYDLWVDFSCDEVYSKSATQTMSIVNHIPECKEDYYKSLKYSFFSGKEYEYDLLNCYNDLEDGKNLKLELVGTTCSEAALTLLGSTLKLDVPSLGSGSVSFRVTDSQGAEAAFNVNFVVKNTNARYIILFSAAVLLGFAAFVLIKRKMKQLKGECQLEFAYGGKSVTLRLNPAETPKKTDLYRMLYVDMSKESGFIRDDCKAQGIAFDGLSKYLAGLSKELKKIKISAITARIDSKKWVAKCRVKARKASIVYNNTCNFSIGDDLFTFGYYPEAEEEDNSSDFYSEENTNTSGFYDEDSYSDPAPSEDENSNNGWGSDD